METKTIKTSKPIVIKSTQEPEKQNTLVIGDGEGVQESETPSIVITPNANLVNESPSIEPTILPTQTPKPTPTPLKQAIVEKTPTPIATPTIKLTPIPTIEIKQVYFKVRIGAFESRSEAEAKVKELESIGYSGTIIEDSEGTYIQLASFKDQERALNFAEEISQRGYSVIIRQIEE
ncbi:MAG: hypothetical protein KatS3mg068_2607 [Candidatus Sericytochromatia bacterium]|nr:MAG: hypothetical protein KatS3mg068_2607 [Candidatus Sericytochromatia bacterium]